MSFESAIRGNIDYYTDHPDKYDPRKIDRETWIPAQTRQRMKNELDVTTGRAEKRRQARREFFQEVENIQKAKKERFIRGFNAKGRPYKYDKKLKKFVKINARDVRILRLTRPDYKPASSKRKKAISRSR